MKILLAPSETKQSGGGAPFRLERLLFEALLPYRSKLLHTYTNIIQRGDIAELSGMFGLKKEAEILKYKKDIVHEPAMKAVERYTGVAFDYLDYPSLDQAAQQYVDSSVIIFSNLFGPIRANDMIPEYKLKQGAKVGDIRVDQYYKENSSDLMEAYLAKQDILDLRAGFYDKFYKPSKPYTTLKFLKDGKVVSHWAKAYRGMVLRSVAEANIETLDDFMKLTIPNLQIEDIQTKKNKTEVIYAITE